MLRNCLEGAKRGLFLAMLFVFAFAGCTYPIKQVKVIEGDKPFNEVNSKNLLIRVTEYGNKSDYEAGKVVFYVEPSKVMAAEKAVKEQLSRELAELLQKRIYWNMLERTGRKAILTRERDFDDYFALGYGVLRIESAITSLKPGVGPVRYIAGYGMGDASLQVEGRLVDERANEVVAEFAVRIHHSGYPSWGWNPRAMSARHCWRLAIEEAAKQLTPNLVSIVFR